MKFQDALKITFVGMMIPFIAFSQRIFHPHKKSMNSEAVRTEAVVLHQAMVSDLKDAALRLMKAFLSDVVKLVCLPLVNDL